MKSESASPGLGHRRLLGHRPYGSMRATLGPDAEEHQTAAATTRRRGARTSSQFDQAMRRCGTRSMPAFRSVVSVLVRFVVRTFSTNSRPAYGRQDIRRLGSLSLATKGAMLGLASTPVPRAVNEVAGAPFPPSGSHAARAAAQPWACCLPAFGAGAWHAAMCWVVEQFPESNLPLGLGHQAFSLVTIRSIGPNKAGQPGCVGLLREREDGPWLLTSAVVTNDGGPVRWTVDERGRQYGSDSPTGNWDDSPNATLHQDRTMELG